MLTVCDILTERLHTYLITYGLFVGEEGERGQRWRDEGHGDRHERSTTMCDRETAEVR